MSLIYEIASAAAVRAAKIFTQGTDDRRSVVIRYGKCRDQQIVFRYPAKKTAASGRKDCVVVYFHGGGYLLGGADLPAAAKRLTDKGWCVACCGYRLLPARFPAQIDDAFAALEAVTAYMADTGLGRRVVLSGNSIGALSAALCAFDSDTRDAMGIDCEIAGLLSVGGVLDLRRALKRLSWSKMAALTFFTRCDASELARYSPICHVSPEQDVPVLCLHGKYDNLVPYAGAMRFVRRLNEKKAEAVPAGKPNAVMIEIKDPVYRHIRLTAGLWLEDPARSPLQREIYRWLDGLSR